MNSLYAIDLSDSETESELENISPPRTNYNIILSSDSESEREPSIIKESNTITDSETESDEETVIVAGHQFDKNFIEGLETQDIFSGYSDIFNLNAATYLHQQREFHKKTQRVLVRYS